MQELIDRIAETLLDEFSGTTVGDGGDFSGSGALSLSGTGFGPFNIQVNINQWENPVVTNPSINLNPTQSEGLGAENFVNDGGKQRLWVQFVMTVDQQVHGQAIAGVLDQAFRAWLNDTSFQPSGTGLSPYVDSSPTIRRPEGQLLNYDTTVFFRYFR